MSPQNRPRSHSDRLAVSLHAPCRDRAAALDLLQNQSLPDSLSVELWLDCIESRHGREMRP